MNYLLMKKNAITKVLLITIIFGLVAHGYRYTNSNVNHDSIYLSQLFDINHIVSIGRFFQPLYFAVRGFVTVPYLIGLLQLLFLGLQNYFILEFLDISDDKMRTISIGILTTNVAVSLTNATYITFSDMYAFAQLLSVLSIFLLYKRFNIKSFIICVILMVISLGIYQTNYQLVIALCIAYAIKEILEGKETKLVVKEGLYAVLFLLISMTLYWAINKIVINLLSLTQLEAYNSVSKVSKLFDIRVILYSLKKCMFQEIDWLKGYYFNSDFIVVINLFLLIGSLLLIVYRCKSKGITNKNILLLLLMLFALPFGMNIMGFLAIGDQHDLMTYSFYVLYILAIVIIELNIKNNKKLKTMYHMYLVSFSILLFFNIVYSNTIYYEKELNEKSTYMAMIKITNTIEQLNEFDINNSEVAFFGTLSDSNISKYRKEFTDFAGTGLEYNYSVTNMKTYKAYINDILGYPMKFADDVNRIRLSNNKYVINMPIYPNKDSIQIVDGIVVVKLSNW